MSVELAPYLGVPGDPVRWIAEAPALDPALVRIAALAPWLELVHHAAPASRLRVESSRLRGEVEWVGPVEARLLEALVELSRALATGEVPWDTPATPVLLRELPRRIALDVYVGPTCAFCPAIAAAALRFAIATPQVALRIVRADLAPDPRVRSTPTVLVDGRVAHVGAGAEYPLAEAVVAAA